MRFSLLGPLEARDGSHAVALGGTKQRALLALLLLHANETLSTDRLIGELWSDEPPGTPVKTLQMHVSRLRKLLSGTSGGGGIVVTHEHGYELRLDPDCLDAHRFERLVSEGGKELAAGHPEGAAAALREALSLWRGQPLADVVDEPFAQREIARLEDLRIVALEQLIEARLRLGGHAEVVGQLETLIAEHPYRERLRGQLMLALYRAERQADALQAYQETRRRLVGDLGIEPGERLRELERAILTQDPGLSVPVAAEAAPRGPPPGDREGAPAQGASDAAPTTRKVVTVLFATVTDAAAPRPHLDPEARRRLSSRWLGELRAVLERHGGMVEGYPGDALLAVFGLPLLHEDDALRAVRAAAELREATAALGPAARHDYGAQPTARVGVATGEVVGGGPWPGQPLVAGDAADLAQRLEAVAAPGEILLDDATARLARGSLRSQPAGPRTARNGEAIAGLRLLDVRPAAGGRAHRAGAPLIGRERELQTLEHACAAAAVDRRCHLVTVLGAAGVGKTRLVSELVAGLGDRARVLRGRCLSYGEGIAYWPLTEIVGDLARADGGDATPRPPRDALASCLAGEPEAEAIVAGVGGAVGLPGCEPSSGDQIAWAVRGLFEALARRRPLVVVLDDLQWAEPSFLDLVEHVADLSRGAAIVLLCIARPELLDERPRWGGGKLNATAILLEPLRRDACSLLVASLLDGATLAPEIGARIADATEGNPLFAEELVAQLVDDGLLRRCGDRWTLAPELVDLPVPPTIHALLAARLERLPVDERTVLACAAVEGVVFHRGAARELAPSVLTDAVDGILTSLVRRDVIRPDRAHFAGEEAFRFRHALIHDAAYRSLAKEARAELHVRCADWLERTAGPRLRELEEIAGFHLEQAAHLLADLGPLDAAGAAIAQRGAQLLESAGRRALARSDHAGAIGLLERAVGLLATDDDRRVALLPDLGAALIEAGRLDQADLALTAARRAAEDARDERVACHVRVQRQFLRLQHGEPGATAAAAATVDEVLPVFRRARDERGLCRALRLRAWVHWTQTRACAAARAWQDAAAHALRAGDEHERIEILGWVASSQFFGPTAAAEGIERCEAIRDEVGDDPVAVAEVLQPLAGLHAMQGRFDRARELLAISEAVLGERGLVLSTAVSHHAAAVELLLGDAADAERILRAGFETLERMGDRALVSTTAGMLGLALLAQGRDHDADRFAARAAELAAADDRIAQVLWREVRARALAARGDVDEAARLAGDAVALAAGGDFVNQRGDALLDLGIVLRRGGRRGAARAAVTEAHALYAAKGNLVAAGRARAELARVAGR